MENEQEARYIVRNPREQPVELHLGPETVVLPAHGELELGEADYASPQVSVLLQKRLLVGEPRVDNPNLSRE